MRHGFKPISISSRGFSLVEMLVCLAVIGLAASMVVPAIAPVRERNILARAVRDLSSVVVEARAAALNSGAPSHVDYSAGERHFTYREGTHAAILEKHIDVNLVTALEASAGEIGPGPVASILFLPDGTGSGAVVTLTLGRTVRRLRVSWLTGELRDE